MKKEWTEQDLRAFAENAQTAFEDVTLTEADEETADTWQDDGLQVDYVLRNGQVDCVLRRLIEADGKLWQLQMTAPLAGSDLPEDRMTARERELCRDDMNHDFLTGVFNRRYFEIEFCTRLDDWTDAHRCASLALVELDKADELLAQMPQDPQCEDIVARAGAKDTYYYSNANMSDNYAMIAQLIEDKDLCVMFAEMVRFNARIYPSATPLKYFQRSPYGLAPEVIEQTWESMQGKPEYADIEELTNNQNERFLFSTKHLTRRYAKAISDVDEFCD